MECTRFVKLLKGWYIQVQDEALAPARMVSFMEKHLVECHVCRLDPEARRDVDRIKTMVLPQDKIKIAPLEPGEEGEELEEGFEGDTGVDDEGDEDEGLGGEVARRPKAARHDDDGDDEDDDEDGESDEVEDDDEDDDLESVDELEVDLL